MHVYICKFDRIHLGEAANSRLEGGGEGGWGGGKGWGGGGGGDEGGEVQIGTFFVSLVKTWCKRI